jgi:hypothetical protein
MTKGEVAGHLKADRQRLRAGELDLLFSLDEKSASAETAGAGKGKKRARR